MWGCLFTFVPYYQPQKWELSQFELTALLHVGISTFVTQKTSTMLVDCKTTISHGGRRRTGVGGGNGGSGGSGSAAAEAWHGDGSGGSSLTAAQWWQG
jgi:hypothetical protein